MEEKVIQNRIFKRGSVDFRELWKRITGAWGVLTGTKFATKAQKNPRQKQQKPLPLIEFAGRKE